MIRRPQQLPARSRRPLRPIADLRRLATTSASLVMTQVVTSVLGFVFWVLAARITSVFEVGVAGAVVALMMLLASVGMLGLGTLLIAEVPRIDPGHRRQLIRTSLATSGVASAALALTAAIAIGPLGLSDYAEIGSPLNIINFAIGTGLMGVAMVLDLAVLAVDGARHQLERNIVASLVKIVALVALAGLGRARGMDIFMAWTIGNLVSLLFVAWRSRRARALETTDRNFDFGSVRRLAGPAASHHVLNLVLQAPTQVLVLVVAALLSAEQSGYFSTARLIAGFAFVLPFSITMALFAASASDEAGMLARMRVTVPFGIVTSVAAAAIIYPLASAVLSAFGAEYATEGLTTLRVLVLAGIPLVIKDHFVALRRGQRRTSQAAAVAGLGALFEVIAAAFGASLAGTVGLCAFWVGALSLEALAMTIPLVRAMRSIA